MGEVVACVGPCELEGPPASGLDATPPRLRTAGALDARAGTLPPPGTNAVGDDVGEAVGEDIDGRRTPAAAAPGCAGCACEAGRVSGAWAGRGAPWE